MDATPDFLALLSDPDLLQLMLFACPDAVVATDPENRVVLYAGASENIFGFPPYEVLNRSVAMLFASELELAGMTDDLVHNGRVVDVECHAVRKSEAPFPAAVSAATMRDRYGEYLGTVAYIRDRSSVRAIEQEMRNNNDQLATLVLELHHVAQHDTLTGLLNRASAIEAAEVEMLESGLSERSFGIVLFDLDHFKAVNDSYGHLVGDAVLAALAGVLRDTVRGSDIVGRFGGEEFIAFLPGAGMREATAFAERVRLAVGQTRSVVGGEARVSVTISAGVAVIPECADSLHEAIRVADDRLYIAKRAGRNRIVACNDELQDGSNAA
ncbi:MAG: sensor domain-containing diguanylate cyclase [Tepidiformaceae bacterium]